MYSADILLRRLVDVNWFAR